jgi:Flp pilus assembly pilin Flp
LQFKYGLSEFVDGGIIMKTKRKKNIISKLIEDERGSPLVEEGMLIGLSLIVIGIIIGLILQILGWSGDALSSIYQQLDQIKEQLLRLLGGSIL